MTLPLPDLDDRRWSDLVEEGRALIPLYGPDWTDHNVHDPGIMVMELLAWQTEMDLFWLNRVPEEHRRKFLALAGVWTRPPRPAQTVLRLQIDPAADPLPLPATTEFTAALAPRPALPWQTLHALTAVPGEIAAIQRAAGGRFTDLTPAWQRGEPVLPWSDDPQEGMALYIGLTHPLPEDAPASLYFLFEGDKATDEERGRIAAEAARRLSCPPRLQCVDGQIDLVPAPQLTTTAEPRHHAVVLEWSYRDTAGQWRPLAVEDETRALTLNGPVVCRLPAGAAMGEQAIGAVPGARYYLRCRLRRGGYEQAPRLRAVALNGVAAQQVEATGATAWVLTPGAGVPDGGLDVGQPATLEWQENEHGEITAVFHDEDAPPLRVLAYEAPGAHDPGRLVLAVERLGVGDGRPQQEFAVSAPAIVADSLRLATRDGGGWTVWRSRPDFDASGRGDAHFAGDATTGVVRFGDGERGLVVPAGAAVLAAYDSTRAEAGSMAAKASLALSPSAHNQAIIPNWPQQSKRITAVTSLVAATGGMPAETVDQATGRALQERQEPQQAVTAADYEQLALGTPGAHLARAAARPNLHPLFPCYHAPGVVTLIVLPYLPARRPEPGPALRQRVASYLEPRRILGTRLEVTGPVYKKVAIRASVRACRGANLAELQQQIVARIDDFLHPLRGGPRKEGWPFGRDVYRSEILHVLDGTPGVEHVLALELLANGCDPQCGNVCLGPLGLVEAGEHDIEVLAWHAGDERHGPDDRC